MTVPLAIANTCSSVASFITKEMRIFNAFCNAFLIPISMVYGFLYTIKDESVVLLLTNLVTWLVLI